MIPLLSPLSLLSQVRLFILFIRSLEYKISYTMAGPCSLYPGAIRGHGARSACEPWDGIGTGEGSIAREVRQGR
jgi:hypothetical protein